jgi:hypothetical protein
MNSSVFWDITPCRPLKGNIQQITEHRIPEDKTFLVPYFRFVFYICLISKQLPPSFTLEDKGDMFL